MANIIAFIVFIGLVGGTAYLGGQWGARSWYAALSKPGWTPPGWLFGPVWAVLYIMIAIAGWLIWTSPHESGELLLGVWGIQLLLNAGWSYIFFGRKELGLALVDMAALWVSIVAFIVLAWQVDVWAAVLFVPYLIWISFASALNASIWMRNAQQA